MSKLKYTALAVALTAASVGAVAQLNLGRQNNEFIRKAIEPALRVVKTSYNVATRDFSQQFGNHGDSVFGLDYSLAVATPAGMIVSSSVIAPWDNDPNYEYFRNDEDLTTQIHDCTFSVLAPDAAYVPVAVDEFDIPAPMAASLEKSPLYLMNVTNLAPESGLVFATPQETTDGFVIWATVPEGANLATTTDLTIKVENAKLEFDLVEPYVTVKKVATRGRILGGVFVEPVIEAPGLVRLMLRGVLAPPVGPNQGWRVMRVAVPPTDEVETVTEPVATEPAAETPVDPDI